MGRYSFKILLFISALFSLFSVVSILSVTHAQNGQSIEMPSDLDAEAVDRFTKSNTIRYITNKDESVNLIVAETGIAVQFSDEFLNKLEEEIKNSENENTEASVLEGAIRSMVGSGVRSILDHAILIPFYELGSVSYENGRIYMTDINGNEIFEDLEINDKQVMEDFSRRDSRRFVDDAEKRLI